MQKLEFRIAENDDLQLIRFWRNSDHVRNNMVFRGLVARDEQRIWFSSLQSDISRYYIYGLGNHDVGVVSMTNISREQKSFEAGIFCGDINYIGHWINVWAYVHLYDIAFEELGLFVSFATILNKNDSAISLNKGLGYVLDKKLSEEADRYKLEKNIYEIKVATLRRYLKRCVVTDL